MYINSNIKPVKSNITITQTSGIVGSANIRVKDIPSNDFFKATSEKEMFMRLVKNETREIDILHFKCDSTLEFPLNNKKILFENEKTSKTKKQIEYGAGSTFKREITYVRKDDDSNKTPNFLLTVMNASKSAEGTNRKIQLKGTPSESNKTTYMLLERKSHNEFAAYPVRNSFQMAPHRELPIDEGLDLSAVGIDSMKKYNKVCESENYTELNVTSKDNHEDGVLSDSEKQEKEKNAKKKRNDFLKRMRYGKKDQHEVESDVGDHENEEIDYMTSDSSMDEEKLDESERQLIYETNDVNEENKICDKVLGKEELLEDDEEELEEKNTDSKKKDPVTEVEEDDADDEDDDDSDDDSDDSSYDSDEDNEDDLKSKKRNFADISRDEGRNESAKRPRLGPKNVAQEMREIIMQQPQRQMAIKKLFKQLMSSEVLQNNEESKKRFFVAANEIHARKDTIGGESHLCL